LSLPAGRLTAIVGPAGAGKSTLLRCAAGLLQPRAGEIQILGKAPREVRRLLGYVPQHLLLDWRLPLSVLDVALLGCYAALGPFRRPGREERGLTLACLEQVDLAKLADRSVGDLSPAQRCQLLLARALVPQPKVLLLDDLLAGLDSRAAHEILGLLERITTRGLTALVTTRELASIAPHFEQVVLLNGTVVAHGRPTEALTRTNLEATFGAESVNIRVGSEYFAIDA
jgi:manganese/zinc/iron transport system ATP- binding protein